MPKRYYTVSVTAGLDTVAVRSPAHPLFRKPEKVDLLQHEKLIYQHKLVQLARGCLDAMGKNCPYILDGGTCNFGIESTVIDLTNSPVKILRHGQYASEIESKTGIKVNFPDSQEKSPSYEPQLNSPGHRQNITHQLILDFGSFDDLSNLSTRK